MSTFDIVTDAPGLLRAESINITLKFDRTGPTTGRVSWNIPTPAAGCTAETQAYCGMVVTLDTKAAAAGKSPVNGTVYSSDPTADSNLFAGDLIATAMVIGAFYQDKTTTYFDITGLKANTPYFVSGYPTDCQLRYFAPGVHAYSTDYVNRGSDGTHGTQVVVLNSSASAMGVQPTDSTGLLAATPYDLIVQLGVLPKPNKPVDSVDCNPSAPIYTLTIDGSTASTYEELVAALNQQFALLSGGPIGPTAPNTGTYYWNASQKKLFLWNGSAHVEVPVIYNATDPTLAPIGAYWLNTTTNVLSIWDGLVWTAVIVIDHSVNPALPPADTSYWFNGTTAFLWNGTTWCQVSTTVQAADPSLAINPPDGSFWYNPTAETLYKWNSSLDMWGVTTAVQSLTNPNALVTGTFWLEETSNILRKFNSPNPGFTGNEQENVSFSEIAPALPAPGKLWYNPTTMELFERNSLNTLWVQQDVIVFPFDPTVRATCDVWWDTTNDLLKVWNILTSTWVTVAHFFQQTIDPAVAPVMVEGATWYDTDTGVLYVWENNCFKVATFVNFPTDPTLVPNGTVWHNTTANTWFVRSAGSWLLISPIKSLTNPLVPPTGTFWFNSTNQGLSQWNGVAWVSLTYSSTPLTPSTGSLWYNTTTSMLMTWDGYAWVPATPIATVELDCNGNLLFTDTHIGSTSYVGINSDSSLLLALATTFTVHNSKPGVDGVSDEPSYTEIGIGTDGTDSVRNAIVNDIRYELGYPVVDVELTKEQMDYAVSRALSELRQRSGLAYKRGFFFMGIKANEQRYNLTNKISGMNKIVDILGIYRLTSSFLSSAHGAGVYGQIVLQHMYNMGTFDLLSYHIMADYTKLMEMLFAARLTFNWNEQKREVWIHNRFALSEKMVCIEATEERTEQDLMTDRYSKAWIRRYATGVCRIMLSEIRGKFSTLPGASGSVTLNAGELRQTGQADIDGCIADIESYVADKPEEYGMATQFTFG
jgi:hypothetical protein